jgi:hypothetical protein
MGETIMMTLIYWIVGLVLGVLIIAAIFDLSHLMIDRKQNGPGVLARRKIRHEQSKKDEADRKRREAQPCEEFGAGPRYTRVMRRLAMDVDGRQLGIFQNNEWTIVRFDDILSADLEIQEDGITHTTSSRSLTGAALGGLTFGPAGAIVGGLGGKTKSHTVSRTSAARLHIQINDLVTPLRTFEFRSGFFDNRVEPEDVSAAREWFYRISQIARNESAKTNFEFSNA